MRLDLKMLDNVLSEMKKGMSIDEYPATFILYQNLLSAQRSANNIRENQGIV